MIAITTLLIKIIFCVLSIWGSVRGLLQLSKFKYTKFIQFVFYISLITYSLGLFIENIPVYKLSLALFDGAFLGMIILLIVKELDNKKNKVMWRIPLITALVAYSFTSMQVEFAFCLFEVLFLCLAFYYRESHNYFYRQQFKSAIVAVIMLLSFVYDDILFLIGLILIINMKFQIINALKLKLKMSEINA